MPVAFNDSLDIKAPRGIDARYGVVRGGKFDAYESIAIALNPTLSPRVAPARRFLGMTIFIVVDGVRKEYWFRDGVADSDLIPKGANISAGSGIHIGSDGSVNIGLNPDTFSGGELTKDLYLLRGNVAADYTAISLGDGSFRNMSKKGTVQLVLGGDVLSSSTGVLNMTVQNTTTMKFARVGAQRLSNAFNADLTADGLSISLVANDNASLSKMSVRDDVRSVGLEYTNDYSANGINIPLWIPNMKAVKDYVATQIVEIGADVTDLDGRLDIIEAEAIEPYSQIVEFTYTGSNNAHTLDFEPMKYGSANFDHQAPLNEFRDYTYTGNTVTIDSALLTVGVSYLLLLSYFKLK